MKKVIMGIISVVVLGLVASCGNPASSTTGSGGGANPPAPVVPAADLGTAWVSTLMSAGAKSQWNSGVASGSGTFVAAGYFGGPNQTWTLVTGVTATTGAPYQNAALAAYDAQGKALWVKTVQGALSGAFSWYSGVARDGSGNLWAAGTAQGTNVGDTFTYGPSLTKAVPYNGSCPLLVEYASDGTPQRALTLQGSNTSSQFLAVACDADGNVYAAGYFTGVTGGTKTVNLGQTAAQTGSVYTTLSSQVAGYNPLLVKYDSSGTLVWAETLAPGPTAGSAQFTGLAVVGSALYAVGWATGTGTYYFGQSGSTVSATGSSSVENPLVVKFDLDGNAVWARTRASGADKFVLNGVTADPAGNLTAVGTVFGTGASTFTTGASLAAGTGTVNPAVVAFDAAGAVRWARTLVSGTGEFLLTAVGTDSNGTVYASGYRKTTVVTGFGDGVTLRVGTKTSPPGLPFLVVYDAAGKALGASGVISSTAVSNCQYLGVVSPATGQAVALGFVAATDTYDFGDGVTKSAPASGNNAVVVKYTLP